MVRNDKFFNEVFMNPLMHLPTFMFGIYGGLIYYRYKKERGYASALQNSFSSRALEMIRHNTAPRYIIYLLALCLIFSSILWQTPYVGKPSEQSQLSNAAYATFSFPIFAFGLGLIVLPALTGKAAAFRFFLCSTTFTPLSHSTIGMYYCVPMISIFYFMTTQHQIHVTYYMFLYYFCGNFMFGMILFQVIVLMVDRPIYAWLNLQKDIKDTRYS